MLIALAVCLRTLETHNKAVVPVPWSVRLAESPIAYVTYVLHFIWPAGLGLGYPYPVGGPPLGETVAATAAIVAVSVAAFCIRRRSGYAFVGWFWFLGMLVPMLGVVQVAAHAMADRYMYLPGIGLSMAVAWGLARLAARWSEGGWVLGVGAGAAIATLVGLSVEQTSTCATRNRCGGRHWR